ncbi:MAG: hypothetical protein QOE47_240 [Pyrinomonadaceae bacterium]|jgi:TonB family protein|nr:hypothetical protein [Pyrinomonadaceae bacterium]
MRKIFQAAILSLLLLALVFNAAAQVPATSQAQAAWETYTFDGEEFSVALPEMPVLDHSGRYINGFPDRDGTARNYGAYRDDVVYLIRAFDKPRAGEDLDYFARDYLRTFNYANHVIELKAQRELSRGKFPGRQYVFPNDIRVSSLPSSSLYVFLTKRHAYVLCAVGGDDDHPGVQRFINSFTLSDKPAGRQVLDESLSMRSLAPVAAAAPWSPDKKRPPASDQQTGGSAPEASGVAPPRGEKPGVGMGGGVGTGMGGGIGTGMGSGGMVTDGNPSKPVSSEVDYTRTFRPGEVSRKAQIIHKPEPRYTEEARKNEVTGTVRLRLVVMADGKVSSIVPVSHLPDGLTETAIRAARHIKFIPAVKDGRKVSQYVTIEYNFHIY